MNCPACGSRCTGKVGPAHFYCWDCCVEITLTTGGLQVFSLNIDGELVAGAAAHSAVATAMAGGASA